MGAVEAQLLQGAEHGGDMAVGQGACDVEGVLEAGDGAAAHEEDFEALDEG